MGELVETGGNKPELPSFTTFEQVWSVLKDVREAVAVAREPSQDLLERMDAAIALAARSSRDIAAAAEPSTKGVLTMYLGLLMKAYANAGLQDAKVFGRLLRDDVLSLDPPIAAVEIACRRWRQKSKFLPAISELLEEVKAAKDQVENTVVFIGRLPALRDRMARDLGA